MSKIICDICGTTYPDTADSCPICGYSQDLNLEELEADILLQEEELLSQVRGGKFSDNGVKKKRKIFDYDAEEAEAEAEEEDPFEDEEEYQEEPKSNTLLVILLVIIITLLLLATGFVFFRYFLPNITLAPEQTIAETAGTWPAETQLEETTEPTVPCESLVITSDKAELNKEGKNWLLHVVVMPENTTDILTFFSEDESITTVTEEGRITAVSEGSTNIYITCGKQQIKYPVEVLYVEETEPATEAPTIPPLTEATEAPAETEATTETEPPVETEVPETTEATEAAPVLKDVELKLGRTDITLTVGYSFEIPLDCELSYEEIEWSVEHEFLATVKDGVVTAISAGTTEVIAKYGDQEVRCMIRCKAR